MRPARSLATICIFARVRSIGTLVPFVTGNSRNSCYNKSENTLREFPLVIATVAKVSRKRGLWLVVRVKGDTRRYLHFYSFSSAASYVGMIQIRYTGLGDAANSQPDPSGSPVCLFFFFLTRFTIYFLCGKVKFAPGFVHDFKTADFAWIHRYFSCIPCSLLYSLVFPAHRFFPAAFQKFPLLPFPPPVLQSKSVNGMQHEGSPWLLRSIQLLDDEDQIARESVFRAERIPERDRPSHAADPCPRLVSILPESHFTACCRRHAFFFIRLFLPDSWQLNAFYFYSERLRSHSVLTINGY